MADDLGSLVARLAADLTDLKAGLLAGKDELSSFKGSVETMTGQVRSLLNFAGISLGFYELISQAKEFGASILEEGSKVEVLKIAVASLADSYGISGAAIDLYVGKLKEQGLTEEQSLRAISGFMKAGVSLDQLPQIAEAAKGLGASVGKPMQEAFDEIVQAIVKGTPRQLADMVPAVKAVVQSMGAEVKATLESPFVSGAEKSQIMTNVVLSGFAQMKGGATDLQGTLMSQQTQLIAKVGEVKEILYSAFARPIALAVTGEETKSWQDLYDWIVKNKTAVQEAGQTVAGYAVAIGSGLQNLAAFVAQHAALIGKLAELIAVLALVKFTGFAAAGQAISKVIFQVGLLEAAIANPFSLVVVATIIGAGLVLKQIYDIQAAIKNATQTAIDDANKLAEHERLKKSGAEKLQKGQQLSPAEMAAMLPPGQAAALSAAPQPPEAEQLATGEANTAAQSEKDRQNALMGSGKGGAAKTHDQETQDYLRMLETERQADLKAAQAGIEIFQAEMAAKKAALAQQLEAGEIDGDTYYARLKQMETEETASALALIDQKKKAQADAYRDELKALAGEKGITENQRADREEALAAKNTAEMAVLAAAAKKTELDNTTKVTQELTKQLEIKRQYAEQTDLLNLETAELLGQVSQQEAILQKLYLDWQKAERDAFIKRASPEDLQALQSHYQAQTFDATWGQKLGSITESFSSGFDNIVKAILDGKTKISQAMEQMVQQIVESTVKMFTQDLASAFMSGLKSLVNQVLQYFGFGGTGAPGATGGTGSGYEVGGGLSTAMAKAFGGATAHGGAFYRGARLAFAQGGVVTQPTFFPMASGAGLMGEAGPEGILPLARVGGDLGVKAGGLRGGPPQVNIYNNTGTSAQPTVSQRGDGSLDIILEKKVADSVMRGGDLQKALLGTFDIQKRF